MADNFETGAFSSLWDSADGSGTAVTFLSGDGAVGSDYYARIEGVPGGGGGLGVSLTDLTAGSPFASDFTASFDFRVEDTTNRQFNLQVSGGSSTPNTNAATINLRYQSDTWSAFNGVSWLPIGGIDPLATGTWNSLTITGTNWGTGVTGAAEFGLSLTNDLGGISSQTGIQIFHADNADSGGARSLNFNDTYGSNPGYDLDNVNILATPADPLPTMVEVTPINPVAYSGIYPHTAVTNTHNEVGIGGLINRNGTIYYNTYAPHEPRGSSDKLYRVDTANLTHTTYLDYPGGTHANRYTDTTLGIDVIGAAYIDNTDTVRYIPVGSYPSALEGRITGTAAHLTDPNKLYYMTMEEGLYEVDFSDLANPVVSELKPDRNGNANSGDLNLPGAHGKGLFTGQGHLYYTNNGGGGVLAEWDGVGDPNASGSWIIVDQNNYTEVTSKRGPVDMSAAADDPIWAIGWDDDSVIFNVRETSTGEWTKFRLPKSSYTHDADPGWFTEWPRIRDVGLEGGYLLSHHGLMFLVPEEFSTSNYGGLQPLASHHKMIVDYVENGDQIVFAGNDATRFSNALVPKANSNIFFLDKTEVPEYDGRSAGYGGVWVNDQVVAQDPSDALLVSGFQKRVLHLSHNNAGAVEFTIQSDATGTGTWSTLDVVVVDGSASGDGYGYYLIPEGVDTQWVRVVSDADTTATAYGHFSNGSRASDSAMKASLASPATPVARSQGLLRSNNSADYKLEFAADIVDAAGNITSTGYYQAQLNPTTARLEIVAVDDPSAEQAVRTSAATTQDFGVDAASVFVDDGGERYRLPMGHEAFDTNTASGPRRGEREVVTERAIANLHGTIYEVPRNNSGGFRRILPITTHNRDIFDFASWRGMLVLSGNGLNAVEDEHYVESEDGQVGLWFGNVDDLYRFGAPTGVGGPWKDTSVTAGEASNPYLMAGYDQKVLELSHNSTSAIEFTIEVDILGTNEWLAYDTLTVDPGATLTHVFEDGYSAHWVRLVSDQSTTATAWFTYSAAAPTPGDYNRDGVVDAADFAEWAHLFASKTDLSADGNRDRITNAADYTLWRGHAVSAAALQASAAAAPEPTACGLFCVAAWTLLQSRGEHRSENP